MFQVSGRIVRWLASTCAWLLTVDRFLSTPVEKKSDANVVEGVGTVDAQRRARYKVVSNSVFARI